MSIKYKFYVLLIGLFSACVIISCGDESEEPTTIKATDIILNKNDIILNIGEAKVLTASVYPANTTEKRVVWTSSNTSVATVENGIVKAVALGSTIITATCGDVSAVCNVVVTPKPEIGKYQYVFGYAYSEDLLKFLTPTITVTINGKEPQVYKIEDGNNTSAEDHISYADISISVSPTWATIWWLGKRFETEQEGTVTVTYERTNIDYSAYDEIGLSLLNLLSKPFVDKSSGSWSINTHTWSSITIGKQKTLKETIDEIVSSSSNTVSF